MRHRRGQSRPDGIGAIVFVLTLFHHRKMDAEIPITPDVRKGRAATRNQTNRFEPYARVAIDDGWARDDDLPPLRTDVSDERPRTVITKNSSPDLSFDRSINLIGLSIRIAAANTAAFTVLHGLPMRIWACRRGWISKPDLWRDPAPRRCLRPNLHASPTGPPLSLLGQIPIHISQLSGIEASCVPCWRF